MKHSAQRPPVALPARVARPARVGKDLAGLVVAGLEQLR